jgi:hypothetical protein
MTTQIQRRRGTTAQHGTFTGAVAELTVDTTKDTVVVHNGSTVGGRPLLREDGTNSALALGSAATPSLKFTGDPNTGIYSPGADQVAISTNGTGRLFVAASGNVGLGTSSPGAKLDVRGGAIRVNNPTGEYYFDIERSSVDGALEFKGSQQAFSAFVWKNSNDSDGQFAERMRLTSVGRLGLGNSSPADTLDVRVNATSSTSIAEFGLIGQTINPRLRIEADNTNNIVRLNTNYLGGTATSLAFGVAGGAERVRFDLQNGRVGIGTTTVVDTLEVRSANGAGLTIGRINNTGASSEPGNINFRAPNASGTEKIWAQILPIIADATNGSEDANLVFRNIKAGSTTESARIDSSGRLLIGTSTAVGGAQVVSQSGFASRSVSITLNGTSTVTVPNGCICTMASDGFPGDSAIFSIKSSGGSQGCYLMAQGTTGNIGFGTTSNPSSGSRLNVWISANNTMSIQDVGQGSRTLYLTFMSVGV